MHYVLYFSIRNQSRNSYLHFSHVRDLHKLPNNCDALIIGAGVMGLATGIALLEAQ
jgi:threonine dehydrogenase-like Zn-dependent dehydrogenase